MEYYGYAGQVLRVDLTGGSVKVEELGRELIDKYIGGIGIDTKLAYDLIKPDIDPLGPDNFVIIGAGALGGTMAPSAGRVACTTKFPVNGAVGSCSGCNFSPTLKWAGYDNIIIGGMSDKPVYLWIFDDEVKLCDASHLWGKDIHDTDAALRDELGGDISTICIGQAGENLVKTSLTLIDNMANLGRGGLAAVLGSKKLKAIVVRGTKGVKIADVETLHKLIKNTMADALEDRGRDTWIHYSLGGIIDNWLKAGIVTTDMHSRKPPAAETIKNYGRAVFDEFVETYPWGGFSCVTSDKITLKLKTGRFKGLSTTASSGINSLLFAIPLGIPFDHSVKLHDLFNRYGMDELDCGYILELAMELYKDGVITKADTGMEMKADIDVFAKVVEEMAYKRGFWGIMADGLPRIVKEIAGAEKYVENASLKGLVTTIDGRASLGVEGFGMLTQPRGGQTSTLTRTPSLVVPGVPTSRVRTMAAHYQIPESACKRIFTDDGDWHVGRLTAWVENINTLYNCMGTCYRFLISRLWQPVKVAAYYKAVTGIEKTPEELVKIGERVWNLQKAANVRVGFSRKDDEFPKSWLTEPIKSEEGDIYLQNFNKTKRIGEKEAKEVFDHYYDERGWDIAKGIPTKEKLTQLGLADAAEDLEKRGLLP